MPPDRVTFGPVTRWEGEITWKYYPSTRPGNIVVSGLFIANLDLARAMRDFLTHPNRSDLVEIAWREPSTPDQVPWDWLRGSHDCRLIGLDRCKRPGNPPLPKDRIWIGGLDVLLPVTAHHRRYLAIVIRDVYCAPSGRETLWWDEQEAEAWVYQANGTAGLGCCTYARRLPCGLGHRARSWWRACSSKNWTSRLRCGIG